MDIDFLNHTTGIIYWKDLNGRILACNQALANLVGVPSPADLIGKTDRDFYLDKMGEVNVRQIEAVDQEVMTKGIQKTLYEIAIDVHGKLTTYLTQKEPLRDENNKIIGLVGTSLDMSNLISIQDAIIKRSVGNLYWKDLQGRFLGANEELLKAHGLTSMQDIVGKTENDFYHQDKELIKKIIETDKEVIATGKEIVREEIGATPQGGLKIFLSKKAPLLDTNNNIIGIVGTSIDVTEQRQAEHIKTEFLENMRHDIRTPLSGIMGFAQLIKDNTKESKISQYAENLMASSQALMNLLNEILEFIQITTGRIPHEKKKFNLKNILTDILNLEKTKAASKNLVLTLEYDKAIPSLLLGDEHRIHRILLELVGNALKFTSLGNVTLKAVLAKKINHDLVIKISVSDTGIGIPEDKQDEVFSQFTKLNPSKEGLYTGLGLGLTIVKQYVKDLEGEIDIKSAPNKGTVFTLKFPMKESLLSEKEKAVIPSPEPDMTPRKKTKVLLVEDQPMPAQIASELLTKMGCKVDIAQTGQSGILMSKAKKYDLIFMDIGLPDVDGNQATREIRRWEQPQNIYTPIIGLTAHVGSENKQSSIEAGMDALFNKPLVKETAQDILYAFAHKQKIMIIQEASKKTNNKVIDLALGASLVGKDVKFAKTMITTLINTFPDEIKALKTAHKKEDWEKIYDIAHRLNGGVSYCGTPRLQKAAALLQNCLATKKTKNREPLYQKFLDEIDAVKDAYKNL